MAYIIMAVEDDSLFVMSLTNALEKVEKMLDYFSKEYGRGNVFAIQRNHRYFSISYE